MIGRQTGEHSLSYMNTMLSSIRSDPLSFCLAGVEVPKEEAVYQMMSKFQEFTWDPLTYLPP